MHLPIAPEPKQRESSNIKCIEKVKLQKETIPKDHSDIPFYKNKQTHPYRNALRTVKLQKEYLPKDHSDIPFYKLSLNFSFRMLSFDMLFQICKVPPTILAKI